MITLKHHKIVALLSRQFLIMPTVKSQKKVIEYFDIKHPRISVRKIKKQHVLYGRTRKRKEKQRKQKESLRTNERMLHCQLGREQTVSVARKGWRACYLFNCLWIQKFD